MGLVIGGRNVALMARFREGVRAGEGYVNATHALILPPQP